MTGITLYYDHINGKTEITYPCRCGQTHRGEYAAEDYAHHNCLHDCRLTFVQYEPGEDAEGDVICPQCGNIWEVRNP